MQDHVKVKICGLTNLADAEAAVAAGADYLGFIFYAKSQRYVAPERVREIVATIRQRPFPPRVVGVFVNEAPDRIAALLESCDLDLAQLHGEEVPSIVNDPQSVLYGRCYKALRPQSLGEAEADAEWYIAEADGMRPTLMLDTFHPRLRGGTGATADWELGVALAGMTSGLLLAGGLTPDNVAAAVVKVRPYGVDVASGVETFPGQKNHAALAAFIRRAREASA